MKKVLTFLIAFLFVDRVYAQANFVQSSEYVIAIQGSIITAYPQPGSNLIMYSGVDAFNVIQAAINALTPKGNTGAGGGKIHINKGAYYLSDELTIIGWENTNNPFSQLVIEGDGFATHIIQNTPGKNAFVVKNGASIVFRDFRVYCGADSKSCLLGDNNGTNSEISCNKSVIDNIIFGSNSKNSAAVYLKN